MIKVIYKITNRINKLGEEYLNSPYFKERLNETKRNN